MKVAVLKLTDSFWATHIEKLRHIAERQGRKFQEQPRKVFFAGGDYDFDPYCEVPAHLGVRMARRPYIELVEFKEIIHQKVPVIVESDEKNEADFRYGEVYLCKHCGFPYATPQGRDMHENRWCKRK